MSSTCSRTPLLLVDASRSSDCSRSSSCLFCSSAGDSSGIGSEGSQQQYALPTAAVRPARAASSSPLLASRDSTAGRIADSISAGVARWRQHRIVQQAWQQTYEQTQHRCARDVESVASAFADCPIQPAKLGYTKCAKCKKHTSTMLAHPCLHSTLCRCCAFRNRKISAPLDSRGKCASCNTVIKHFENLAPEQVKHVEVTGGVQVRIIYKLKATRRRDKIVFFPFIRPKVNGFIGQLSDRLSDVKLTSSSSSS